VQSGAIGKVGRCILEQQGGVTVASCRAVDDGRRASLDLCWRLRGRGFYRPAGWYHPENWRKRLDFGTGTFGDMGCHIFDPFSRRWP